MDLKHQRKEKILNKIIIIVSALFLAASFYVVKGIHSDDTGAYKFCYWTYELGSMHFEIEELLEPWTLIWAIVGRLWIGDVGADTAALCFSIGYFFIILFTLSIALNNIKNRFLIPLLVFILMPWTLTNEFHYESTLTALALLWGIDCYEKKRKKGILAATILFAAYMMLVIGDKLLLLIIIAVPAMLYFMIWSIEKKERHKYLYFLLGIALFIMALVRVAADLCGISMQGQFEGYGGSEYMFWTDSYTFFNLGIPSVFSALLDQYNIPLNGGFVQFQSVYWIIRIAIVCLMLFAVIARIKDIKERGIERISRVDSISILALVSVILINAINGILKFYGESLDVPINRYAALVWFLLPIVFIRWLDDKYKTYHVFDIKGRKVTSGLALGMIFVFLIIGYSQPIYKGRKELAMEPCQSEVDFLDEHRDRYNCGLATYWKSYPISAISNGEHKVCSASIESDNADHDRLYIESNDIGDYINGSNYFNFLITREYNSMSLNDANVEKIRGDYIEKRVVDSHYNRDVGREYFFGGGDSTFYLYDYDIRFAPHLIMEAVGVDYELVEPIAYYFDFPVGTNRIEMEVGNAANFELSIEDNSDVSDVNIQVISENKIYVDLLCAQNTSVQFNVARKADETTTIHKIVTKRVKAAVKVETNEIYLKPGSYIVTFDGSNLHNASVVFDGDGIVAQRLTDGRIQNRYRLDVDKAQAVSYTVTGRNAVIDEVHYENSVLF